MPSAQTTEVFDCSVAEFFAIIQNYERYPEFLSEVKKCKVLSREDNRKLVEFTVHVIKQFSYRLWITEEAPIKISWVFESGDLFKVSEGSWELSDEAGRVRAKYFVDTKFKVFVPGPIGKALVSVNLPNMMASYRKRVKDIYGKG